MDDTTIKNVKNPFRLKIERDDTTAKTIKNLFVLK